jgi:DNA-binding SARP family transcriptional activator
VEFRLLGLLAVHDDGRPISVPQGKERALLAVLLLHANEPVSADTLLDQVWAGRPPANGRKALQIHVSRLRKLIGVGRISTTPIGYCLRIEARELDTEEFSRLCLDGRRALEKGDPASAEALLGEALALWRGEPLADFPFEPFAQEEIRLLAGLRATAAADLVDARLALGRTDRLIEEVDRLIRDNPVWERPRAQLMLALYRQGRQAEALTAYQDVRSVLVDELGLEPSRQLRELEQAILRQDPALDVTTLSNAPLASRASTASDDFVGRSAELGALVAALDEAATGRGSVFLVTGEPGIGKSRLAEQLAGQARARGALVLAGRCWEAGGAPAYWPWVQALRSHFRGLDPDQLRREIAGSAPDLAHLVPELSELLPELPESRSGDPATIRFRLFDAVSSFLRCLASERPVVLVLDDLHAADEPSLLLLRFLTRELGSVRLLVVGAYRDVDPTVQGLLASAIADLVREPVTHRIELAGFEQDDVAEYIERIAEIAPDEALVEAIHTRTDGNPLFITEVVRLLASEGRLDRSVDVPSRIPVGVRDAIGRHVGRLSAECREILELASVLGREFRLDALEQTSGLSRDGLLSRLEEGARERVISEVVRDRGRFRFSHVLMRDSLYESLPAPLRLRLHREAGEAFERLYARDIEAHLAELAHQFLLAGGTETGMAFHYACRAGDRAMAQLAYEEAVRLYRMAVQALEVEGVGDESTRCELLLSLADAEQAAGEGTSGKETFLKAAEIARKLDRPEQLAEAALGYSGRFAWPRRSAGDARLVPLLEDGLAAVGDGDSTIRAQLLTRLACAMREQLSPERRDLLSGEAVAIARRLGDPQSLFYVLMGRWVAIWAPDNVEELREISGELVRLADDAGEPEWAADARLLRLECQLIGGDIEGVNRNLDEAARLAAEAVRPSARWHVEVHRAELALLEGRFIDAEQHIAEMARLGEQAQVSEASVAVATQSFALRWSIGGLEPVAANLEQIAAQRPGRALYPALLAVLALELGDKERARGALEALTADDFGCIGRDREWMLCLCLLNEVAAVLADAQRAALIYRLLTPYGHLVVVSPHDFGTGSAARSLGVAASTCGHLAEAERHFEAALALNRRIRARPWLARTECDYARMLFARDRPDDAEHARALIGQAMTTYRELGMGPSTARAQQLVESYG